MKALIIEDEYPAAERLEKLIRKLDLRVEIAGVLANVESAREWFKTGQPVDLIFSKSQLSDGLSFPIFESLPAYSPIIFSASFDGYAIKAFAVKSIDFLLKLIKLPELADAIRKHHELSQDVSPQAYVKKVESLLDSLKMTRKTQRTQFLVKNGEQLMPISQEQVAYVYMLRELACLVGGRDARQYLVDYTPEELEILVDPFQFFRLNRQLIAQVTAIQKIHTYCNGTLGVELRLETARKVRVSHEKPLAFKPYV